MQYTLEQLKEMMDEDGSLYLSGTPITSLPDNMTVGGWLDLRGTQITSLPENLTVGESLDIRGTPIESKEKEKKIKRLKNGDYVEGRYLYCDDTLIQVKRKPRRTIQIVL